MHDISIPAKVEARYLPRGGTTLLFGGLVAVGAISFFLLLGSNPDRAWQAYVSNWLLFTSLSVGGMVFAAATTITKARWNWSVRRITMGFSAFLPLAFLLLLPMLFFLRENYFPWIEMMAGDEVIQRKAAYLNIPFLLARNVGGALLLFALCLVFTYTAVRPDLGPERNADEGGDAGRARWRQRLTSGWLGQEEEEARSWARLKTMAPALVLVAAVVMSMFAVDWAMTLLPHWYSTMFPAWFFMGAFWGGIALTALVAVLLKRSAPYADEHIGPGQFHDLGQLTFGFSVFWTYLFWAQYLVIWYGKLPWEQEWIVQRSGPEWGPLSVLTIVLCFVVPFAALIGRAPKMKPAWLGSITALVVVGLWLERFLLVAPSLHVEGTPTITAWEPLITLGFVGLFGTAVRWFLATFPMIQVWQPKAELEMVEAELPAGATR